MKLEADKTFVFGEECLAYKKSDVDKYIEEIVNKVQNMFREIENCIGLDTTSPLGKIANVAYKHWQNVEHTHSNNTQLRKDKAYLLQSNNNLRNELKSEKLGRLNDKIKHEKESRHHKRKRSLAMANIEYLKQMLTCDYADCTIYKKSLMREKKWKELSNKFTNKGV